jgi:hypothetical protein
VTVWHRITSFVLNMAIPDRRLRYTEPLKEEAGNCCRHTPIIQIDVASKEIGSLQRIMSILCTISESEAIFMRAIGFRASPSDARCAVVEGSSASPTIISIDRLRPPAAYDWPKTLTWYREQCQNIIAQFEIGTAMIRTAEPLAMSRGNSPAKRANIEGVLMEACAAAGLNCELGPLATISRLIQARARECIEATKFRSMSAWCKLNHDEKETVLAALAAMAALER